MARHPRGTFTSKQEAHRDWCRRNPDRRAEHRKRYVERVGQVELNKRRRAQDYSLFGATLEDFDRLVEEQGGRCAICREPLLLGKRGGYAFDHDHTENTPRGVLCAPCNVGIGGFRDRADLLLVAAAYLTSFTQEAECTSDNPPAE